MARKPFLFCLYILILGVFVVSGLVLSSLMVVVAKAEAEEDVEADTAVDMVVADVAGSLIHFFFIVDSNIDSSLLLGIFCF